jgi:hypothetical protein
MPLVGTVPGDPYGVAVATTEAATTTVWLESGDTTGLTREDAERLAALVMTAVRHLGG